MTLIDPTSAKVFAATMEHLNFTKAATHISMTQSGVSQHISRLEETFNVQLFIRNGKKIIPSKEAHALLESINVMSHEFEALKDKLMKRTESLNGVVKYAMPESCLLSPHFDLLLKERLKKFPEIHLEVLIKSNSEIIDLISTNQIDFGFVTQIKTEENIHYEKFCLEEHVLVGPKITGKINSILELPIINHPDLEMIFSNWKKENFPGLRLRYSSLKLTSGANSLEVVKAMLKKRVGFTFISRHCISDLIKNNMVVSFYKTSKNTIKIASLKSKSIPNRVKIVKETFLSMER